MSSAGISSVKKGAYFFVPFAAHGVTIHTKVGMELIECLPPAQLRTM
jgi:hypothetical protein